MQKNACLILNGLVATCALLVGCNGRRADQRDAAPTPASVANPPATVAHTASGRPPAAEFQFQADTAAAAFLTGDCAMATEAAGRALDASAPAIVAEANFTLGRCAQLGGRPDQAADYYRKAIESRKPQATPPAAPRDWSIEYQLEDALVLKWQRGTPMCGTTITDAASLCKCLISTQNPAAPPTARCEPTGMKTVEGEIWKVTDDGEATLHLVAYAANTPKVVAFLGQEIASGPASETMSVKAINKKQLGPRSWLEIEIATASELREEDTAQDMASTDVVFCPLPLSACTLRVTTSQTVKPAAGKPADLGSSKTWSISYVVDAAGGMSLTPVSGMPDRERLAPQRIW